MTHTKPLTKRIQPVPVEKAKDEQRPDLLIPKAQFQQEVQVIAKNLKTEIIFHESAVEALQEVAEAHLMGLIEDASVCATYDNRVTIMPKDIQLAR